MKNFKIYYTSDTHGYIFPTNYATGENEAKSLISLGQQFNKDENTLVIDGGDTISGSPFTLYLKDKEITDIHPISYLINSAQYDYITLGNHDFNFGVNTLNTYLKNNNAKCICANVSGDIKTLEYDIVTLKNGLKIGITGIVTDHVNIWESNENLKGIHISEPLKACASALNKFKNDVDITICIYHGGFEGDISTGEILTTSTENIGLKICNTLNFDILLTGHQHNAIQGSYVNNTYVVQPSAYAAHAICIEGIVNEHKKTFKSYFIQSRNFYNETEKSVNILKEIDNKVWDWLNTKVGTLEKPLVTSTHLSMALNGSDIATLINQVQLWATNADISVTSLANDIYGFKKDVTIQQILANYPYINNLRVLLIAGAQLKQVIEKSLTYFNVENGNVQISKSFLKPKVEHYNYDYYEGIQFTANLLNPPYNRVVCITKNGNVVSDTCKFTICVSSYRAQGAGNYTTYKSLPIIKEIQTELTELIYNYISQNKNIVIKNSNVNKFIY